MDKGVKRLLEEIGAFDEFRAESPAAASASLGPEPSAGALQYRAAVLELTLMGFVRGRHFDICPLDKLAELVDSTLGRPAREWPDKTAAQAVIHPVLHTLHCVDFAKMSPAVRAGLPSAIVEYMALDEASGAALIGAEAWARVMKAYADFAEPARADEPETEGHASAVEEKPAGAVSGWFGNVAKWLGRGAA